MRGKLFNRVEPKALRFRRWSRKAYAAFVSVSRTVTIGQLSTSVADRLQKKHLSLHSGADLSIAGFMPDDDRERGESECTESLISFVEGFEALLCPIRVSGEIAHKASYEADYTLYYIENRKGGRYPAGCLPPFYLQE